MDGKDPPLFRKVAVEAAAGTQLGEPLAAHWRGVKLFTLAAFCLVVGLFVFVSTVEYAPIHRIPCYTDVRNGLVRLNTLSDVQVISIAVAEGSRVRKGQLLAVLSSDVLRADGGSEQLRLQEKLTAERRMIDRELDAASDEASANHTMIERRLVGLRAEYEQSQAELAAGERLQRSLATQSEKLDELMSQGYATALQLAQKRDEVTTQEGRVAAARAALSRIEREIATSKTEYRLIDARRAGLTENRHRAAGELERLMVQSEAQTQRVIRAPMDGTVSTALIAPGQSIVSGQALFTISPAGEPLVVRLLVPARAAASVAPGMRIKVVFRAFPREKFGEFSAHIDSVSAAAALPADIERVMPVVEPAFIAVASLPQPLRGPDGQALSLKPGMLAEALVPIERRTLLEWLFEPLLRGFNDSAGRQPAKMRGLP